MPQKNTPRELKERIKFLEEEQRIKFNPYRDRHIKQFKEQLKKKNEK